MSTSFNWSIVLDVGVGVGVLLIGLGVIIAMVALAGTFKRLNQTLDEVDRQMESLGKPVADTLTHVNGIVETADTAVARLATVTTSLENVANSVAETTNMVKKAIEPSIVNVGATLSGVSTSLRRLFGLNHD